jgi:flavin-dependent dehydrogenase
VIVLERNAEPEDRIGEVLPAAARTHLERLGLWQGFERGGHRACRARRSVWGGPEPVEQDGANGEGIGWRLDRRAFEGQLRSALEPAGVRLLAPTGITGIARDSRGWAVEVVGRSYDRPLKLRAALVVDAGGRASRSLRPFGQTRLAEDRLVCAWIHAPLLSDPSDLLYVESDAEGWWSSAPLPDGRRVIAFHTDSDLPVTGQLLEGGLAERARLTPGVAEATADSDLSRVSPVRFCAAHGGRLDRAAGEGWLAVGDAAICFDPVASSGLLNAFETAEAASRAAARMLAGDEEAAEDYDRSLVRAWRAYRQARDACYADERRWQDRPFWSRRLP